MNLTTRPAADRLDHWDRFARVPTAHTCGGCGFPLNRVAPSNMVTCDNPVCAEDPKFLVPLAAS